jgi:[acyl-carrier-protein] S-malonyltransferase
MRVAVLFPGQGSQYPSMADPWLDHPAGKEVLARTSELLGWDVTEASRDPDALGRTEIVQPAMFACDMAAFAVLRAEGAPCDVAAGHSLGEYAALVASNALTLEDGLAALAVRAESMGKASRDNPGTMTALVGLTLDQAREVCAKAGRGDVLAVANENAEKQTVLSGSLPAIERAEELARSQGGRVIRIQVAGAFHSPLMEPALGPVREAISRVDFHPPDFPVVPNASGQATTQPLVLRDLLSRHIISPVRWNQTMRSMAELGATWFLEAGPGDVLGKLARRAVPGGQVRQVGSPEEARAAAEELRRAAESSTPRNQEAR